MFSRSGYKRSSSVRCHVTPPSPDRCTPRLAVAAKSTRESFTSICTSLISPLARYTSCHVSPPFIDLCTSPSELAMYTTCELNQSISTSVRYTSCRGSTYVSDWNVRLQSSDLYRRTFQSDTYVDHLSLG